MVMSVIRFDFPRTLLERCSLEKRLIFETSNLTSQEDSIVTCIRITREFKQIATVDDDTATGSKCPPKCDAAHVRRLYPAVARNLTT